MLPLYIVEHIDFLNSIELQSPGSKAVLNEPLNDNQLTMIAGHYIHIC